MRNVLENLVHLVVKSQHYLVEATEGVPPSTLPLTGVRARVGCLSPRALPNLPRIFPQKAAIAMAAMRCVKRQQ